MTIARISVIIIIINIINVLLFHRYPSPHLRHALVLSFPDLLELSMSIRLVKAEPHSWK